MLRLLHFSDIHFNNALGVSDDNIEIRDGIEKDLKQLMEIDDTQIDYILVCGDIAFSGNPDEYLKAREWLNSICNIVKCRPSSVLVVPGNHDVTRDVIKTSFLLNILHDNLRNQSFNDLDKNFANLTANGHIDILKLPQKNYHEFASVYGCNVSENHLYWELKHENFYNFDLIFRGCNSAILSNKNDDTHPNKMALSKQQYYIKDEYKTLYIILCHHPVECLIDKESVENSFNSKAILQLYGHNHKFHVENTNNTIIIHAGAVQPEKSESGYDPCYNLIDIDLKNGDDNYQAFIVKIWIREWKESKFTSGVSNNDLFEIHTLPLKQLSNPWVQATQQREYIETSKQNEMVKTINKPISIDNGMEDYTERDVRYKFLTLPFRDRKRIGNEMFPDSFNDGNQSEMARSLEFLNKIKEDNRYTELWNKIK